MPPATPTPRSIGFEQLAEIATGSTASVALCRAVEPERDGMLLAVKRLHPELADDPAVATRFLDEVWMTASLQHPNVVGVVGWGTDDKGDYLACELVQGVSLARLEKTVFETGEQFPERMVVYIGLCLCRGLSAAHTLRAADGALLQLVHRDLCAENVLVGFNGDVKIADFGLAKAKQRLTQTTVGLPQRGAEHMAPEEAKGRNVDHRADLFALGVLLFELLAGRPPWKGPTEVDTLQRIVRDPPSDLIEIRPKMDKNLVPVIMKCLEKDPAKRYQVAGDIASELESWLYAHGYHRDNVPALARFVRRNAMRQMRWFERAVQGRPQPTQEDFRPTTPQAPRYDTPSGSGHLDRRTAATAVDLKPPRPGDDEASEPRSSIAGDADQRPTEAPDTSGRRDTVIDMESPEPVVIVKPEAPAARRSHFGLPKSPALLAELDSEEENAPTIAIRRDALPWLQSDDTTEDTRRSSSDVDAVNDAHRETEPNSESPAARGKSGPSTPPPLPSRASRPSSAVPRPSARPLAASSPRAAREPPPPPPVHRSAHPPPPPTDRPPAHPPAPPRPVTASERPAPVLDVEGLIAEVERLRARAARRKEEAETALELARRVNEEAELATRQAQLAEESASLAKQAQRAAESGDQEGALKLLEKAQSLAGPRRGPPSARPPRP